MNTSKIIGGNHGLPTQAVGKTFKKLSKTTLINARSCLHSIMKHLNMPTIWMPSYLCESLLHESYNVKFYEVDKSLTINEDFLSQTKSSDAILIIDYFGFTQNQRIYERIKQKKCVSIEDASQSLFSERNTLTDFTIYSLTKCLGLPDGGMIESSDPSFKIESVPPPLDFIEIAYAYRKKRAEFDKEENNEWYSAYLSHKKMIVPVGQFDMSDLSKSLYGNYDQFEIVQKTRENYETLQKHLTPIRKLEKGISPIGFPMLHEKRDKLLSALIKEKIYPPVHWKLKQVPKKFSDSYWLSARQITLPCDQRYKEEDMEKVIKCVKTL